MKTASQIKIPTNKETGELSEIGHASDWTRVTSHPDSNEHFRNKFIPSFDECVREVLLLHKAMPFARSIGWDVTVDVNGAPCIIEWNGGHNGIKYSQATQGPCFADLIAEVDVLPA